MLQKKGQRVMSMLLKCLLKGKKVEKLKIVQISSINMAILVFKSY